MKQGFSRRLMVCGSLVVFGFCMLGVKLFIIQIRDRDHLVAYAERQLRRTLVVRPRRGDVVDARGRPLAVSINAPSLFANARVVADPRNTSLALKEILGGSAKDYFEKLSGRRSYVWLKRKINPDQQGKIEKLGIDGLGFVTESMRFYPKRELASSLVGFVGVDDAGMYGVEQSYQEHMGGRVGRIRIQRDAKGRPAHPESRVLVPARPGADVRLTIDEVLQHIVEKELRAQVRRVGARRAIGVMVEPQSGRILALASVPGVQPQYVSTLRRIPLERARHPGILRTRIDVQDRPRRRPIWTRASRSRRSISPKTALTGLEGGATPSGIIKDTAGSPPKR